MTTLRPMTVLMPFHTPFYAPLAAGAALGHFRDEGLDVTAAPASAHGGNAADALTSGRLEVSLSGIMRSLVLLDQGGPRLVHFIEVCRRNGFFLLSREPRPAFRWSDLVGRTVIDFAEAPTPWQCLLAVLRRHGVDPAQVRIERARPGPEAVAAFLAGEGDFLEQTQPVVERLLAAGQAHLVASMGEATGPIPFTSYMAAPGFLEREPDVALAFTRAVYRTQRWLAAAPPKEIAAAIAPHFADVERPLLDAAVARYVAQDTWARDPLCRRPGYDYLQETLLAGGLITHAQPYESLIDTTLADAAMASTPKP
jgi:NitT/TauT family transport system substrate-binding protein